MCKDSDTEVFSSVLVTTVKLLRLKGNMSKKMNIREEKQFSVSSVKVSILF